MGGGRDALVGREAGGLAGGGARNQGSGKMSSVIIAGEVVEQARETEEADRNVIGWRHLWGNLGVFLAYMAATFAGTWLIEGMMARRFPGSFLFEIFHAVFAANGGTSFETLLWTLFLFTAVPATVFVNWWLTCERNPVQRAVVSFCVAWAAILVGYVPFVMARQWLLNWITGI